METDRIDADEVVEMFVWIAQWDPALMKALITAFLKSTRAKHAFRYSQVSAEELIGLHESHALFARMVGPTRQGRSWYKRFPHLREVRAVSPEIVEMGRVAPEFRKEMLTLSRTLIKALRKLTSPEQEPDGGSDDR